MKHHFFRYSVLAAVLMLGVGAFVWHGRRQQKTPVVAINAFQKGNVRSVTDTRKALSDRLKAAREISTDLTDNELRQLFQFLSKPIDERNRENDLLTLNEVMNQLRLKGLACGEYSKALCSLIRDPKIHPIVRDYAIQHSVSWIKDAYEGNALGRLSDEDRKNLLDCIVSFLQEPSSLSETGYGTALNALGSLESACPEETQEIFAQCAPRIFAVAAGNETCPLSNRVSAIQTLPALPDRKAALEIVRSMAMNVPTGSPVRLVSIATLGVLGERDDIATLRKIQHDDSRVSYAARTAADRLEANLPSSFR